MAHLDQIGNNREQEPGWNKSGKSETEIKQFKKILFQNMSMCCNATGYYKEAIDNLTKSLESGEKTTKALY